MNRDRVFSTFGALPIGARFVDPRWDEPCVKTSDTGARDKHCARGFEVSFRASEPVIVREAA